MAVLCMKYVIHFLKSFFVLRKSVCTAIRNFQMSERPAISDTYSLIKTSRVGVVTQFVSVLYLENANTRLLWNVHQGATKRPGDYSTNQLQGKL